MKINEFAINDFELDADRLNYYESILNTKIVKEDVREVTIEQVKADRWFGNLYGLFLNELGLSPNSVYINMRINGYSSSLDYKGELKLKILEPRAFNTIIETYLQNKALKKSLNMV